MKRLAIGLFSLAALLVLVLAPAKAVSGNDCCHGQCSGQACCRNHQK